MCYIIVTYVFLHRRYSDELHQHKYHRLIAHFPKFQSVIKDKNHQPSGISFPDGHWKAYHIQMVLVVCFSSIAATCYRTNFGYCNTMRFEFLYTFINCFLELSRCLLHRNIFVNWIMTNMYNQCFCFGSRGIAIRLIRNISFCCRWLRVDCSLQRKFLLIFCPKTTIRCN